MHSRPRELDSLWLPDSKHTLRLQGSAKRNWPGLVNFALAFAYYFCLNLPAAFMKSGHSLLVEPCTCDVYKLLT